MKKTDMAMIAFIASISILVSYYSAKAVIGDVYSEKAMVKTIDLIQPNLTDLSVDVFNENAINPTVKVNVDDTK